MSIACYSSAIVEQSGPQPIWDSNSGAISITAAIAAKILVFCSIAALP